MKNNYILYSLLGVVIIFALILSLFTPTTISVPELFEVENEANEITEASGGSSKKGGICQDDIVAPREEPPEDNGDGDNSPPDDF